MTSFSLRRSQKSSAPSSFSRNRRVKRRFTLESLESRTLLSYTFSYTSPTATVTGTTGTDSLVISPVGGSLEWSVNNSAFSSAWVGGTPPAIVGTTVNLLLESGDGASLQLGGNNSGTGTTGGPASALNATFILTVPSNTSDTVVIDDSASTAPSTTYTVDTGTGPSFPITGPGINFQEPIGIANGGITLKGGSGVDTYNVVSTFANEPVTIAGGASIGNIVNVGSDPGTPSSSTLGNIHSLVTVNDLPGTATLNLLDAGDTASAAGNITGSTVTGLGFGSGGSVAYAGGVLGGVTSLVIDGGTSADGDSGVTYNFTSTSTDTTLNDGPNADTVNITGTGVAFGSTLTINDDTNTIVNYDAGGGTPVVTPGATLGDSVVITLPGSGTVDANSIEQLNITDVAPIPIVPGPAQTINTVEGFNLVDAIVATFESPVATIFPTESGGPPASDFTATIDWGDPSPDLAAGTITQDASNPSVYYVTGTHTFVDAGTYTVANTVDFAGGPVSSPVNGVPVFVTLPPSGPTAGTNATANVTDPRLTGSAGTEITGVEGSSTGTVLLGTFRDNNQAATVADYTTLGGSVVVNWGDGSAPQILAASNLVPIGTPDGVEWTINAAHTYTEEGTYSYTVTVTDNAGPSTIVSGSAIIADAALTAGAATLLTPSTGVALPATTVVATFTDANTFATTADYTTTIDWGDGSPKSTGVVVATATPGLFHVEGPHTYANPGVFTTHVTVRDDGGQTVVVPGSATVTDQAVTGATKNFTATEGKDTGLFVLATFTDPNTLATVANENAVLAVGGWGDGTPGVAGITLVVQQIGVTPLTSATNPGAPIFEVLGSHTYAEETPAGLPDTLSVIVTTLGGTSTTLTSPPGGGVTVLDAALTSSNGTTITGTEGILTPATTLIGTFTDTNQGATSADFLPLPGGNGGSIVVNWGDGTAPQTLTAANITATGTPNGVVFTLTAGHDYVEEGTYPITIKATDDGGATTIISSTAIISAGTLAPLAPGLQPVVSTTEAALFSVPVFAPPLFKGPVAAFTDSDPLATISDYQTLIDWGDGTPMTAGTVSQPGGVGTAFVVSGSHTYADSGVNSATNGGLPGTYVIQVFVVDQDGARLTISNPNVTVADNPIVLTGVLNPKSDSGLSTGTPDVTNVKQPDFYGTSEPFSHVTLFATALPSGAPVQIGQVQAGSDGAWNIKSVIGLTGGHYEITATAVDQFGVTTTTAPTVITPDLLIDTTGPVIAGMFFNPLNGQVDYIIKNPVNPDGSAPSGVWVNTLLDSSNYLLTTVHAGKAHPGKWVVTNVTATADPTIANAYDVAVTFNGGATIKGGYYLFTIRDSSNGHSSVQDLAENHLDGVFYGSFPSGNGINGSDFVAELEAVHGKVFAPQTIIGTANAQNGGNGGLPVAPIHSGIFVTALPRGASPIFSTSTSPSNAADPPAHKVTTKTHKVTKLVTVKVKLPAKPALKAKALAEAKKK